MSKELFPRRGISLGDTNTSSVAETLLIEFEPNQSSSGELPSLGYPEEDLTTLKSQPLYCANFWPALTTSL